jgi:hypothetical protein
MNKTELNNLKKVIAAKYKEMEDMQNNLFKQMTTVMFDSIPELKSVSFTGYTPSFNDGDACNFSCQTKYPCVNGYDSNRCGWEDGDKHSEEETEKASELCESVGEILGVFPESFFAGKFGTEGFLVTITPTEVSVEEYDCGY